MIIASDMVYSERAKLWINFWFTKAKFYFCWCIPYLFFLSKTKTQFAVLSYDSFLWFFITVHIRWYERVHPYHGMNAFIPTPYEPVHPYHHMNGFIPTPSRFLLFGMTELRTSLSSSSHPSISVFIV